MAAGLRLGPPLFYPEVESGTACGDGSLCPSLPKEFDVKFNVFIFGVFLSLLPSSAGAVGIDLSGFRSSPDFSATASGEQVTVDWKGEAGIALRLKLNLAAADQLIAELSHAPARESPHQVVLKEAAPAFWAYIGKRQGTWEDSYFDNPSRRPNEISEHFSKLIIESCRITSEGNRLLITIPGLWMGVFHGDLVLTLYAGSNLVRQEAVMATQEPAVAYYYDAWLTHCNTNQLNHLLWLSADDRFEQHRFVSDVDLDGPHLKVHRRTLIAEGPGGSLAVFPPPHQYFFPRDETINYGNLWYRLYSIGPDPAMGDLFSFGIRQTPYSEEAMRAPLVNAPPGTEQHMAMFWYIGSGSARQTFDRVSAYTHNDVFVPLSGYKTFTSHYHLAAVMDWIRHDRQTYTPEFVTMFRHMGINMAHIMDFHGDGHSHDAGEVRLREQADYFHLTRQLSGPDFLLIPGEELHEYFGGHWTILLPKPVFYFLLRNDGQPFIDHVGPAGLAYRIGSPEDMLEMIHREGGLAWQTHPRTKGSVGFPDANKNKFFFKDPAWLGGAFKAMPADNSSPRLGERALKLLDDMNNWGDRKFMPGEVDIFKINHTHELYGHMNTTYVRLNSVPQHPDWSPLVSALRSGDFFVTTGEILIRDFKLNGVPAGGRAKLEDSDRLTADVDLDWTFPLNFCELVWGNGQHVFRKIVPATDTGQFGRRHFRISESAPGARWARFAVWDIAANGAMTQPVRLDQAQ